MLWREAGVETVTLDCVFPVLHGENGEDGSIQGLMQVAGIPCVGSGVEASASSMDKTVTKLLVGETGIRQANWYLARRESIEHNLEKLILDIESGGDYPLFVKPSGTGSSVGVSKVRLYRGTEGCTPLWPQNTTVRYWWKNLLPGMK